MKVVLVNRFLQSLLAQWQEEDEGDDNQRNHEGDDRGQSVIVGVEDCFLDGLGEGRNQIRGEAIGTAIGVAELLRVGGCLLYTSPSPRDRG